MALFTLNYLNVLIMMKQIVKKKIKYLEMDISEDTLNKTSQKKYGKDFDELNDKEKRIILDNLTIAKWR